MLKQGTFISWALTSAQHWLIDQRPAPDFQVPVQNYDRIQQYRRDRPSNVPSVGPAEPTPLNERRLLAHSTIRMASLSIQTNPF